MVQHLGASALSSIACLMLYIIAANCSLGSKYCMYEYKPESRRVLYVHHKHAHGMRLCNTCISNVPYIIQSHNSGDFKVFVMSLLLKTLRSRVLVSLAASPSSSPGELSTDEQIWQWLLFNY